MAGHVHKMPDMHPDPNIMAILDRLENACGANGETGRITCLGVYTSGGRQSTWIRNEISTDDLLNLITDGTAGKVLTCIGNSDRESVYSLLNASIMSAMTLSLSGSL